MKHDPARRSSACISTAVDFASGRSTSTNNATVTRKSAQFVRVTHPFHPLSGQRLLCVGVRYNRYGKRLLLQVDDSMTCSVPPQWTDTGALDPEVVLGTRRALFRVTDLLELEGLVGRLIAERPGKRRGRV
jgi:hypothetical protein